MTVNNNVEGINWFSVHKNLIWEKPPKRRRAAFIHLIGGYFNLGLIILQGLLLVPLYLHYIGPRLYGLWLASGGVLAWMAAVDLGLGGLMIQRISSAYGRKDGRGISLYFFNGLLLQFILMVLLVAVVALIASWVPAWFKATVSEAVPLMGSFILAAISMALSNLNDGAASLSQSLQRPLFMNFATAACTLVGLLTTILLLWREWGLWAIPSGLLARNFLLFSSNICYSFWLVSRLGERLRYDKEIVIDMVRLSPALFASRFGSGLVGSIEATLITVILQPELAAAFAITKRVIDMIKLVLDRIAGATFSGFVHLYAKGELRKVADVTGQVLTLLFNIGLVCMGAYVAGNASFVRLWVGESYFVGQGVTILLAISIFMAVFSNLISYLLGATGDIAKPSFLIGAEAIFRIVLMALLLSSMGLVGLPVATAISCSLASLIFFVRFAERVPFSFAHIRKPFQLIVMVILIGGGATAFQHFVMCEQWWQLVVSIFGFISISGAMLLYCHYQLFSEFLSFLKR